uniref:Uncharacterized protein n=1 Tax=Arundo donax TaxID=35708 RepID=A0A0A9F3G1_ARUDO
MSIISYVLPEHTWSRCCCDLRKIVGVSASRHEQIPSPRPTIGILPHHRFARLREHKFRSRHARERRTPLPRGSSAAAAAARAGLDPAATPFPFSACRHDR